MKVKTIAKAIVALVAAIFLSGIIHYLIDRANTKLPTPTPDNVRQEMQAQADRDRRDKQEKAETDALVSKAMKRLKAEKMAAIGVVSKTFDAMRDQQSMTILSLGVVNKPEAMTACLEYAAKNGFGGMNRGQAVWQFKQGGTFKFAIDKNTFWNKECANIEYEDYTSFGRLMLEELKKKG